MRRGASILSSARRAPVLGASLGAVLAGAGELPRPRIYDFPELDRIKRRTVTWRNEDWRVAYAYVRPTPGLEVDGDAPILLQVAETLEQRTALANEILRGIIARGLGLR